MHRRRSPLGVGVHASTMPSSGTSRLTAHQAQLGTASSNGVVAIAEDTERRFAAGAAHTWRRQHRHIDQRGHTHLPSPTFGPSACAPCYGLGRQASPLCASLKAELLASVNGEYAIAKCQECCQVLRKCKSVCWSTDIGFGSPTASCCIRHRLREEVPHRTTRPCRACCLLAGLQRSTVPPCQKSSHPTSPLSACLGHHADQRQRRGRHCRNLKKQRTSTSHEYAASARGRTRTRGARSSRICPSMDGVPPSPADPTSPRWKTRWPVEQVEYNLDHTPAKTNTACASQVLLGAL